MLLFLLQQSLEYLSIFLVATNIFLTSPQIKREIQLPQYHGTIPTTTFQSYFLLYSYKTHLSYRYWGRYIGGTAAASPLIGYPNTILLRELY